ncbi:MAG: hypothetical protein F4Z97_02385 [Gammaproteobacteria bacterium]|nr:hypothetical protein [Gammaproteobacteria bacterium]MYI89233.1 hypothetical protein [Gammaproteobacteria bacterium]
MLSHYFCSKLAVMYLCYVDESGTLDIPDNTSHFVLAALSSENPLPVPDTAHLRRLICSYTERKYTGTTVPQSL